MLDKVVFSHDGPMRYLILLDKGLKTYFQIIISNEQLM